MQFRLETDRVLHERQRTRPERLGDQPRRDVDDAIAESLVGAGAPVVLLVRMEDKGAAGPNAWAAAAA